MTPETFGAVGDGKTDDTAAIKEAAKHTSETGELFTDNGGRVYRVSEPITFHNKANVDLFDSAIRGRVIVSKKEPGTMRLRVITGNVRVSRLPKASKAQFRADNCGVGIYLAGDIEACDLDLEVEQCTEGVLISLDSSTRTFDECNTRIRAHDVHNVLHLRSGKRQITGRFAVFAEQVRGDAIFIGGACRVTLAGQLRGICKGHGHTGLRAYEQGGRPHITLNNLSMIGSRVENTQPFKLDGVREFGGTFQVTNF